MTEKMYVHLCMYTFNLCTAIIYSHIICTSVADAVIFLHASASPLIFSYHAMQAQGFIKLTESDVQSHSNASS